MSSHRRRHKTEDKSTIYPVKLIFDEDWNYSSTEDIENNSDKSSSNSHNNKYDTSTKIGIKESTYTTEKKHSKHGKVVPEVLNPKVLKECKNHFNSSEIDSYIIPMKVPVIVAGVKVFIDIENKVKLGSHATAIKRINRRVFLRQCTLITKAKKLFLNGIIRKSIEYSEPNFKNNSTLSGKIKNITVYVPFSCVTDVDYIVDPEIEEKNSTALITLSKSNVKEETLSETYNEITPIYCEIINADFKELNIKEDLKSYIRESPDIYFFKSITQKMVMNLTIRLIQNQRIFVNKPT